MASFAPTSEETLEDQRLYTQARLTEVACLDCLATVGVKKNSEHHTSIQWHADSLEQCAEFRKLASSRVGATSTRPARGCGRRSSGRWPRARSRSGPWMATESFELRVLDVIEETADAHSIVFEVPDELQERFAYTPGQFLTVAVPSDQTGLAARCYSLSSAPHSGRHQITVKRTVDGYASNWIFDNLREGDTMRVLPPSGIFTPRDLDSDLLLFAGGSGITPVMSITRTALEKGHGKVVLFYANRDEQSVIFGSELASLSEEYADRLVVVHWLESVQGLPTQAQLLAFATYFSSYTAFVCGPAPFMKAVVDSLKELGFPRDRRHQEKFVSLGGNPFGDVAEMQAAAKTLADADDHEDDDENAGRGPDRRRGRARRRAPQLRRLAGRQGAAGVPRGEGRRRAVLLPRGQLQRLRVRGPRGRGQAQAQRGPRRRRPRRRHPARLPVAAGQREAADHLQRLSEAEESCRSALSAGAKRRVRRECSQEPRTYQPRSRHSGRCGRSVPRTESLPWPG